MAQPECDLCLISQCYTIGMEFAVDRRSPVFQPSVQEPSDSGTCLVAKSSLVAQPPIYLCYHIRNKSPLLSILHHPAVLLLLGLWGQRTSAEAESYSSGPEDTGSWLPGFLPVLWLSLRCEESYRWRGRQQENGDGRTCEKYPRRLWRPNPSLILIWVALLLSCHSIGANLPASIYLVQGLQKETQYDRCSIIQVLDYSRAQHSCGPQLPPLDSGTIQEWKETGSSNTVVVAVLH